MASGCVVLASDTEPHREALSAGRTALLVAEGDEPALARHAMAVLTDTVEHRPLGDAASRMVVENYARDVCLPRLALELAALARKGRARL
jgi:glycosyltransferase involved in cell wall biosynthesis